MRAPTAGGDASVAASRAGRAAAAAAAALLLVAWPLYGPAAARLAQCRHRLAALQEQRQRKSSVAARHDDARRALERVEAARQEAEARLPRSEDLSEFVDDLSRLARAAGLRMSQVQRRPRRRADAYELSAVELRLNGTYAQLVGFLDRFARMTRPAFVGELRIAVATTRADAVLLDVRCVATTAWTAVEGEALAPFGTAAGDRQ